MGFLYYISKSLNQKSLIVKNQMLVLCITSIYWLSVIFDLLKKSFNSDYLKNADLLHIIDVFIIKVGVWHSLHEIS